MSSASNVPAPTIFPVIGDDEGKDAEYVDVKNKGLFIIITDGRVETYEKAGRNSIEEFKDQFNLGSSETWLIERKKLTWKGCTDEKTGKDKPFGKFIKVVSDRVSKKIKRTPEFVFCILLCTSSEHGLFELSDEKCGFCTSECTFTHACKRRRITDLVRAFQQAEGPDKKGLFAGKPKIFLIQTIDCIPDSSSLGKEDELKKMAATCVPRGSDTFVFYAHTAGKLAWIKEKGWYLMTELCFEIHKLKESAKKTSSYLEQVKCKWTKQKEGESNKDGDQPEELTSSDKVLFGRIQAVLEKGDIADGYFDNFFVNIAANMAKKGVHAPHISSTLRKNLQMAKILSSQGVLI